MVCVISGGQAWLLVNAWATVYVDSGTRNHSARSDIRLVDPYSEAVDSRSDLEFEAHRGRSSCSRRGVPKLAALRHRRGRRRSRRP
jgi:hypothetical protein